MIMQTCAQYIKYNIEYLEKSFILSNGFEIF